MDKLKKKIPRNLLSFLLIFCTVALSLLPLFIYFSTRTTLMDFVRIDLGQNHLGEVYEGNISCTAEFDEKALKSKMPLMGDAIFESAFVGGWYFYDCVKLTVYVNGHPRDSSETFTPGVTACSLSSDDEIAVKAEWKFSNPLEYCLVAMVYGAGISKLPDTYRTTVRDEIKRQGLELKTAVELDVLGYIEENDLLYSKDNVYGDTLVFLKKFETEINGYTIKNDNELSRSIVVISPDGYAYGGFEVTLDDFDYYKYQDTYQKGRTCKVSLQDDTSPYGFVFTKRDYYYTVE